MVLHAATIVYQQHLTDYISMVQQIPGLVNLNADDFTSLVCDNMNIAMSIKASMLLINGESYMVSEGVQLSKKWMCRLFGPKFGAKIFDFNVRLNKLALTSYETALLIPLVIAMTSKKKYSILVCLEPKKLLQPECETLKMEI